MDLSDTNKEANGERVSSDAEKLREEMSREQQARREGEATHELLQACADELQADLQQRERTINELRLEAQHRAAEAVAEGQRAALLFADLQRRVQEDTAALHDARASFAATAEESTRQTEAEQKMEESLVRAIATRSECDQALAAGALVERAHTAARLVRSDDALRDERKARAMQAAAAWEAQAANERALAECTETMVHLMRRVAAEAEARWRSDSALRAATEALQEQAKTVLELTDEKKQLQNVIRGMQGTIANIQKALAHKPACAARREPPQHTDSSSSSSDDDTPAPLQ